MLPLALPHDVVEKRDKRISQVPGKGLSPVFAALPVLQQRLDDRKELKLFSALQMTVLDGKHLCCNVSYHVVDLVELQIPKLVQCQEVYAVGYDIVVAFFGMLSVLLEKDQLLSAAVGDDSKHFLLRQASHIDYAPETNETQVGLEGSQQQHCQVPHLPKRVQQILHAQLVDVVERVEYGQLLGQLHFLLIFHVQLFHLAVQLALSVRVVGLSRLFLLLIILLHEVSQHVVEIRLSCCLHVLHLLEKTLLELLQLALGLLQGPV